MLSSWLKEQGYSLGLQKRYRNSHWLESIGHGAMKRIDECYELIEGLNNLRPKLKTNNRKKHREQYHALETALGKNLMLGQ